MITLVIKGGKFEAARMAADRGVPLAFVRETAHGETVGHTGFAQFERVARWYGADCGRAPFPVGTLLHYSYDPR